MTSHNGLNKLQKHDVCLNMEDFTSLAVKSDSVIKLFDNKDFLKISSS